MSPESVHRAAAPRPGLDATRRVRTFLGAIGTVAAIILVSSPAALAFYQTTDSSNPGLAAASSLSAPTTPTATATSSTSISVAWSLPTTQISGAKYQVTRTSPGSPTFVCTTTDATVTSCLDSNLIPGTAYAYSIDAVLPASSWQSSAITASATTPKETPTVTTSSNPSSVTVGGSVDDQATLSSGFSPTGTITWKLYASTDTTCTGTMYFTSSPQTVSGDSTYTSSSFTTNAVGSFKWGLSYSGDGSNNAVPDCGGTSESLTVTQATPSITTTATSSTSVGGAVTDTATLSNGYNPSGTITYTLYGPSATASCTAQVGQVTSSVSGNGGYTSPAITPTSAGTYWWTASYGGDANNQTASDTCGGTAESSTVNPVTPSLSSNATPASEPVGGSVADQATLSAGYSPTGTITWNLYANSACTGVSLFTTTAQVVNGNSTYTSSAYSTTALGTYTWAYTYGGDVNNNSVTHCGGSNETVTVTKASPSLTTSAPANAGAGMDITAPSISAVLSGGYSETGAITFTVFGPSTSAPIMCTSGGTTVGSGVTVSGNGTYHPTAGFTPSAAGNYWWYASYGGDTSNSGATSTCGAGMAETVVSPVFVTITSVTGNEGNVKVTFSGTGTAGASVTLTICKVNSFPCSSGNTQETDAVSIGSNGLWSTGTSNLSDTTTYWAQASATLHSASATSNVLAFVPEKTTSAAAAITTPAAGTCYYNTNSANCTTTPQSAWPATSQVTGTASASPALQSVQVAIENPSGMWWDGSSFSSSVPVYLVAVGTSAWTYSITAAQLDGTTGTFTIQATATDADNETGSPSTARTFTWKD